MVSWQNLAYRHFGRPLGLYAGKRAIRYVGRTWKKSLFRSSRSPFFGRMPRHYPMRYASKKFKPRNKFRGRGRLRKTGYFGRYNKSGGGGELKFIDFPIDPGTIVAGATIVQVSCNAIAQGISQSQRIGRKCTIKAIQWRYALAKKSSATAAADDIVRIIVYLDRQCNGATALTTDVLSTADYQSFYSLENTGRFQILMDRTHAMNSTCGGGNGTAVDAYSHSISGKFYKRCNIPIEFSSTTGVITEISSNNIGVMMLSRDGTCELGSNMRIRFRG